MYDTWKVVLGIVVFLGLVAVPVWMSAEPDKRPDPKTPEGKCIESVEVMRAEHMEMLMDWRDIVVREGRRTHVASDGQQYDMSLTMTCMGCHTDKKAFCDDCHDHVGVEPDCWRCHVDPSAEGGQP